LIDRIHLDATDGVWPEVRSAEVYCREPSRRVLIEPDPKAKGKFKESLK
jgi:hypothetical protein